MVHEFDSLFSEERTLARYYIFFYYFLLFCTLLLIAFLQKYSLYKFITILVLHFLFLIYVLSQKPFISKFSNFRAVMNQLIILALLVCNLVIVVSPSYSYALELGIMICICLILLVNITLYTIQMVLVYLP